MDIQRTLRLLPPMKLPDWIDTISPSAYVQITNKLYAEKLTNREVSDRMGITLNYIHYLNAFLKNPDGIVRRGYNFAREREGNVSISEIEKKFNTSQTTARYVIIFTYWVVRWESRGDKISLLENDAERGISLKEQAQKLLNTGMQYDDIGFHLKISPSTVKALIENAAPLQRLKPLNNEDILREWEQEPTITISALAARLGVSYARLYQRIQSNHLKRPEKQNWVKVLEDDVKEREKGEEEKKKRIEKRTLGEAFKEISYILQVWRSPNFYEKSRILQKLKEKFPEQKNIIYHSIKCVDDAIEPILLAHWLEPQVFDEILNICQEQEENT